MINAVLYTYLIGWVITSIGMALFTGHQSRRSAVIVVAGAAWPILVLVSPAPDLSVRPIPVLSFRLAGDSCYRSVIRVNHGL